jgi:hypothetical protein
LTKVRRSAVTRALVATAAALVVLLTAAVQGSAPPATAPPARSAATQTPPRHRIDEQLFNEAIWQSVKGPGVPMPVPRHLDAD